MNGRCSKARLPLLVVLGASWGVRIALVQSGGQLFFPDEIRYFRSVRLFAHVVSYGEAGPPLDEALNSPDHIGFVLFGAVPEAARYAVARLLGMPQEATSTAALLWIPALILSLASVAGIALIYAIARRAGASHGEGLTAAALMACSNALFYYARHLIPYDVAMAMALLALWIGLDSRSALRSIAVGVCTSLAFLTYNGYWILAAVVVAVHVVYRQTSALGAMRRAAPTGLGLLALPALLTILSIARKTERFPKAMTRFAGTVTQGDYAEGWSFPWEYLWHAEHGLLLVWALGAALVVGLVIQNRGRMVGRGLLWLGAAMSVYLLLAVGSTGGHKFVVYGRLSRQLVPFLCLATAAGFSAIAGRWPLERRARLLAGTALAAHTMAAFAPSLGQTFPGEVEQLVAATFVDVGRDTTIQGCCMEFQSDTLQRPPRRPTSAAPPRYVLLNSGYLYPVGGTKDPPPGTILLRFAHPFQFLPYQYESFGPAERAILRATDISMRLIDTEPLRRPSARGRS